MPCTSCHGEICTSCHVLFGLGAKLISIFYIGQAQRMRLGKSFQPVYYTPLPPPMHALPTIFSGITVSACIGPQSCLHVTPNSESTSYWPGFASPLLNQQRPASESEAREGACERPMCMAGPSSRARGAAPAGAPRARRRTGPEACDWHSP